MAEDRGWHTISHSVYETTERMRVHSADESAESSRFAMSLLRAHASGCTGVHENHGANESFNVSLGQEMHAA